MHVLTAGVAPGPEGRLWVFFGSAEQTFVTRTSKAAGGFEPVQTLASPKAAQYFRLEGEGSAGPLDLFVDLTVDGQAKDGTYQTHVLPVLSLVVATRAAKTGTRVTVRVLDAGDPIAGARVTGLPGGAKTTDATGSIVLPAARKGAYAVTATRAGYLSAKARVTLYAQARGAEPASIESDRMLRTELTRLLGLQYPIVQAPMAGAAYPSRPRRRGLGRGRVSGSTRETGSRRISWPSPSPPSEPARRPPSASTS